MNKYFDGWITDHLPDHNGNYLVSVVNDIGDAQVYGALYYNGHWGTESKSNRLTVTAWAELPEPYNGGDSL